MLIIREMLSTDIDTVHEIEEQTFMYAPWSKDSFLKELQNEHAYYFVAELDSVIIGYAGMWHIVNEGHVNNVAVRQDCRGMGTGHALMCRLIEKCMELSMIGLTLEVRISNIIAQRMYTKLGFKPEGFRKKYYDDTKEDAIIMWKWLQQDC